VKPLACILFGALFLMSCETSTPEPPPPPPPPPTDPTFEVSAKDPVAVSKQESTKLLVYYHTWFQTKEVDAYWGIRWRMNTKDPETILPDGRREIARHYYPAMGPYSSRDTLVLQLQSLWMKYSDIDGVSIDWYGTSAVIDYDILRGATETAMTQFANAGLSSHVVLQDKSIYNSMYITQSNDTLSKLTADFNYLKQLSQEPAQQRSCIHGQWSGVCAIAMDLGFCIYCELVVTGNLCDSRPQRACHRSGGIRLALGRRR
jgi:hypothetical protein